MQVGLTDRIGEFASDGWIPWSVSLAQFRRRAQSDRRHGPCRVICRHQNPRFRFHYHFRPDSLRPVRPHCQIRSP